ncbi:MAG TPA: ATP-binding protein [Polyangiaceae bacterium]|nr:ATP-binding protein [Polyangiaceae bacterium]
MAMLLLDADGLVIIAEGACLGGAVTHFGPLVGRSALDLAGKVQFAPDVGPACSGEIALRRALAGENLDGLARVESRVFETRVTPRMDASAAVDGACVLALDVTGRQEAQSRAFRNERLDALRTLAAGVADEINNPLTYILINIEYVMRRLRSLCAMDRGESPTGAELCAAYGSLVDALAQASEGAERVRGITRKVLVFAEGDAEAHGPVDVRAVLESSLQMAWHEIRHRARLVKELASVPPVEASETSLAHVFLQLFLNAARAIPEGNAEREEVRVRTSCSTNGDVVVEIVDTGCGIAPEVLGRVFDPFFTTRSPGDGMGLGLSMCHGIVKHLGGKLSAESVLGQGSLFRVVLPSDRRPSNGAPGAAPPDRSRVLLVDADPRIGEAIARSLGEESELTIATDVHSAVELVMTTRFDLVLCDLMLPESSGVDFYVELLRVAPAAVERIAFMTGGASSARTRAFLSSTSNPCLEKPLEMSVLRRLVSRARRRRS